MTRTDFLRELQDMLQTDEELQENSELASLEEWDSLAYMVLIAFFDKNFGQRLTFEDLGACKTPGDLIALAQGQIA